MKLLAIHFQLKFFLFFARFHLENHNMDIYTLMEKPVNCFKNYIWLHVCKNQSLITSFFLECNVTMINIWLHVCKKQSLITSFFLESNITMINIYLYTNFALISLFQIHTFHIHREKVVQKKNLILTETVSVHIQINNITHVQYINKTI